MAQSELMQMAELAMKKHKAVVSNWREGRIKKVWQDEDGNLCVMYNSGHWWHYRNLDQAVPEWWYEVITKETLQSIPRQICSMKRQIKQQS